jgi:hypothetical protein
MAMKSAVYQHFSLAQENGMNLDESLIEAQNINGPYEQMSERAQAIKFVLRQGSNWDRMSIPNKEALETIATCIAKILEGAMNDPNHWNMIARYARLRGAALEKDPINPIERYSSQGIENAKAAMAASIGLQGPHGLSPFKPFSVAERDAIARRAASASMIKRMKPAEDEAKVPVEDDSA